MTMFQTWMVSKSTLILEASTLLGPTYRIKTHDFKFDIIGIFSEISGKSQTRNEKKNNNIPQTILNFVTSLLRTIDSYYCSDY